MTGKIFSNSPASDAGLLFAYLDCLLRRMVLTALLILMLAAAGYADAFVMVKDGLPACFIVLSKDAPKAERFAAQELTAYIEKMTGAQLPVREMSYDEIPPAAHAVLIGQGSWLDMPRFSRSAEDLDIQGPGSYVISAYNEDEPGILLVSGGTPRATVYAVCEILNRLGVRWYTPDITRIPHHNTINLGDIDIFDFPCFSFRGIELGNGVAASEWTARLRLNKGPGFMENELGCRPEYVPLDIPLVDLLPDGAQENNKEMFPLVDGKRTGRYDLCCFTNFRMQTAAAESIIVRLSGNPGITHVVLHTEKSGLFCECDECAHAVESEGSAADVMLSWLDRVSGSVTQSFEHVTVELAIPSEKTAPQKYHFTEHTAVRLSDEMLDIRRPFEESIDEQVMGFVRDIGEWVMKAENVTAIHPIGSHDIPFMPFPDFYQTFENTTMYRDEYLQGLFFDFSPAPGITAADSELRTWVLSRLLWNSDLNGESLVREWIKGVYGYAWGPMLDYWKHLQKIVLTLDVPLTVNTHPGEYITEEWLNTADRMIRRGYVQSMTDSTAHRYVRKARLSVWFARLFLAREKIESGCPLPSIKTRDRILNIIGKWESEMNAFGYARVSRDETVAEFVHSLRKALGK